MLLITGHPRSGTGYLAALFQRNGYDVGHETWGKDGCSNWQLAVDAPFYDWGDKRPTRDQILAECDQRIFIQRKPIDVVNSVAFTEQASQDFRRRFYAGAPNIFEDAILSIYVWHKMIREEVKPTLTLKTEFAPVYLDFKWDVAVQNQRPHYGLSEADLHGVIRPKYWKLFLSLNQEYYKL
jgi:hypothetical protein